MSLLPVVLGSSGLLGGAFVREFEGDPRLIQTIRSDCSAHRDPENSSLRNLCVGSRVSEEEFFKGLPSGVFYMNAIGVINKLITDSPESVRSTIEVNSVFPHRLAAVADITDSKVLQIGTDCVFSGKSGGYDESAAHDARDLYGMTKSLGEVIAPSTALIRCSIVGPEKLGGHGLWDWVYRLPEGATVKGFTNHFWNGVTVGTFAKLAKGIFENRESFAGVHHLVPAGSVSKYELVNLVSERIGRNDLKIVPSPGPEPLDRTLSTTDCEFNERLWSLAGYPQIPTIEELVFREEVDVGLVREPEDDRNKQ